MMDAETGMRQAGYTAEVWLRSAKTFVEEHFEEYSADAKATLIAAYIKAAAGDQLGMYVRALAENSASISEIAGALDRFER